MKYIVVVGDGMADRPLKELGGKTPLEAAKKPSMDYIASHGKCGRLRTLREDMPLGSDIANLSIMGYDPLKYYPGGRGPLEAASLGISLGVRDLVFRCNLINQRDGKIIDHSGGHITNEEARALIRCVKEKYSGSLDFYPGTGYRNIAVLRDTSIGPKDLEQIPPHDIIGREVADNLIKPLNPESAATADELNRLMQDSIQLLSSHPVNQERTAKGKLAANMLWLWGAGKKIAMPSFKERYGVMGCIISAVDLLKGIGTLVGLDIIEVPGATGYFDTDYAGKAEYALNALKEYDFVYLHIEAPDEAGHEGKIDEKIKAIESIDKEVLGRILKGMEDEEFSLAILPDHATPIEARTHTIDPVPFAIYSSGSEPDSVPYYSEKAVSLGSYGIRDATELMDLLFEKE